MDDDTRDLIAQLCTRIGMIMEDTSVVALTISGRMDDERRAEIDDIKLAARQISALIEAVGALLV